MTAPLIPAAGHDEDAIRQVPMRLLCLGMPRTGTLCKSFQRCKKDIKETSNTKSATRAALKILGFNEVYHMVVCLERPKDSIFWLRASDFKFRGIGPPLQKQEFDEVFADCQAVIDFPASAFAPELIAAYPDAKVLLTHRDVDKWHKSMETVIFSSMNSLILRAIWRFDDVLLCHWFPMVRELIYWPYDGDFEKNGRAAYKRQSDEVRSLVPKENLLEFEVQQGWGPLCSFLELPIPDEPFPYVNDAADTKRKSMAIVKGALGRVAWRISPVIVAIAATVATSVYYWKH